MASYRAKPPHGCLLNRADPVAKGLVGAWLCREGSGTRVADSAGALHLTAGTASTWERTAVGPGLRDAGTTRAANTGGWVIPGAPEPNRNFSLAADLICRPGAAAPNTGIIFSAGLQNLSLRLSAATTLEFLDSQTASAGSATIPTVASGDRGHVGLTIDAAGAWVLFWNGRAVGSGTTAANFTNGTQGYTAWLFDANASGNREYGNHTLLSGCYWGRVVSAADMRRLAGDPQCIWRRRRVPVPLSAAAGGGGGNRRRRALICGGN